MEGQHLNRSYAIEDGCKSANTGILQKTASDENGMSYRIFVVDDDQHYARMLSYRLDKNPDYSVKVFNSGEEALKGLSERPDLILLTS